MSLKKDNLNSFDKKHMQLAINLAKNQKNNTGQNPSVGCVIVKNRKIVSFSNTNDNGRPHAETIALKHDKKNNKGSTVYLSLEPCSHYGKTPPCTNALIKSEVKKVYFSKNDSDERSKFKAIKILKNHKILTKSGILKSETNSLYKEYDYVRKNKLPYVVGKIACFKNNYIYNNNLSITNNHSKSVSHLLRSQNDAILTSYKTINKDNPKLTCRLSGLENKSPKRVILDVGLKIKMKSFVIKNAKFPKTIIIHNSNKKKKISKLKKLGVKMINLNISKNSHFNLVDVLKKLHKINIHKVLVEVGKDLTNQMISCNFYNEFYLFKSSRYLNPKDGINISKIIRKLNKKYKKIINLNTYLDKDNIIHYH